MIVERVCDLGANHSPTAEGRRAFSYAGNIFRIRKDTLLSALAEKTAPRAERPSMPGNYRFVRRCNVTKESITAQWPETACGCLWVSYSRNGIREDFQVVSLSANEWPQALQSCIHWMSELTVITGRMKSIMIEGLVIWYLLFVEKRVFTNRKRLWGPEKNLYYLDKIFQQNYIYIENKTIKGEEHDLKPVSYTHLTLPTILRV